MFNPIVVCRMRLFPVPHSPTICQKGDTSCRNYDTNFSHLCEREEKKTFVAQINICLMYSLRVCVAWSCVDKLKNALV